MPRILHIFVVILLIGSVAYSYRVKYHSIALANEMTRLKKEIEKTKNEIAEAKAEWQVLNNPERLQKLADAHTATANMKVTQIIRWSDLPNRPPPSDSIADKLMLLGEAHRPATSQHGSALTLKATGKHQTLADPSGANLPLEQAAKE